ncbi:DUF998 domain-containing protein [Dactylosporangium sp. NPDC000521]|uniref:DUF998 domain-containing protein n=1 Tax=Dactylosporangium sp. NPDC000521 TaxID=3363975 RepID=UPI00367E7995
MYGQRHELLLGSVVDVTLQAPALLDLGGGGTGPALGQLLQPRPQLRGAGLGLFRQLPSGAAAKTAGVLTLVAGALLVVAGLARPACSDWIGACQAAEAAGTVPLRHVVHNLVSVLLFLLLIIAVFTLARAAARNGARRLVWPSIAVGVVSFVTMAAMVGGAVPGASGLLQRLFVLVLFGWVIAVGPLTARVRAAGMPAGGPALQRPVEVP